MFSCLTNTPGKVSAPPAVGSFSVLPSTTRMLLLFHFPSSEDENIYFLFGKSTHYQMEQVVYWRMGLVVAALQSKLLCPILGDKTEKIFKKLLYVIIEI